MQQVPSNLASDVSRELAGERILWEARPDRWAYAQKYWKTAVFGIPFLAFSLFWEYQVSQFSPKNEASAVDIFFPLWGLMFIGFGLAMLLSPLYATWASGSVYYVVTERRAVIFEKPLTLKIHSFDASGFGGFERVSRGGPGGNIIFRRNIERRGRGTRTTDVGFIGLSSFAEAEQALRRMMESRGRA